jgi:phenylalanyl-tRNA synthetase beta chain
MLISLNWLKQYIDLEGISIEELDNTLTMIGQEVEKIDIQGENLKNIVTAQILEKEAHPDSDHLTVCKVDDGNEVWQIICGASNHKQGDKVVLARIGAVLGEDFKIKKTKIRGLESCGMLCSEKELGLSENHDGIMILPEDTKLGIEIKDYFGLDDTIFELEITPNRPDCLSHIGIARELAVYYNKKLKKPEIKLHEKHFEKTENFIHIEIADKTISKRYTSKIVKGVTVKESPEWLQKRLNSIGIRSINNIVDITNFVLMEMGHPIHAFDLNKIEGKKIIVRRAKEGEKLVTLDEKERELNSDDIVIADEKKAVALGGVMGGYNSEIESSTKDVLIEVAHFNPYNIRKTSKRLTLSSDASYRFERGIDLEDAETVADRVAELIKETAGGEILHGVSEAYPVKYEEIIVEFNLKRFERFVGKEIEKERIIEIFENLEINVDDKGELLLLTPPSFREDLEREQDFYEEIIRIYGFDNIESVLPELTINQSRVDTLKDIDLMRSIAVALGTGLREVINYSFIPRDGLEKIRYNKADNEKILEVRKPITEDFVIMRPTLLYSLIKNAKDNINRNITDIRFFETTKIFKKVDEKIEEEQRFGIILGGEPEKYIWNAKPASYDFYDIKGIVEEVFSKIRFEKYSLVRTEKESYHPGRAADVYVGREYIGTFGELHPDVIENFDLKKRLLAAEFKLESLVKYSNKNIFYKGINKFPSVPRDLALVIEENILVGEVIKTISKLSPIIEKVELFDVYQGAGVETGKKSIAISIVLREKNKTLEENEINLVITKILEKVKKDFGAELRQ